MHQDNFIDAMPSINSHEAHSDKPCKAQAESGACYGKSSVDIQPRLPKNAWIEKCFLWQTVLPSSQPRATRFAFHPGLMYPALFRANFSNKPIRPEYEPHRNDQLEKVKAL